MKNRLANMGVNLNIEPKQQSSMPEEVAKMMAEAQAAGGNVSMIEVRGDTPAQFTAGLAVAAAEAAIKMEVPFVKALDFLDDEINLPTGAYIDVMLARARTEMAEEKKTGIPCSDDSAVSFLRLASERIERGEVCPCARCASAIVFKHEIVDGKPHEEAMKLAAKQVNELRVKLANENKNDDTPTTEPTEEKEGNEPESFSM